MQIRIRDIWSDDKIKPSLDCTNPANLPLIITSLSGPELIVRP